MSRRKKITAGEMILKGGYMNFRRAVRHASRYGVACSAAGHLLTMEEYSEVSGLSLSQAYRERVAWRACCGDYSVLEVVSTDALGARGFTEEQREDVIARELAS